jgi:succinate dehydrogenase / fumarate reductase flavoprotein subunit
VSLHGANRLGSNSTAECLVWGKIAGAEAARNIREVNHFPPVSEPALEAERKRIFEGLLSKKGPENLYDIRRELRSCMDTHAGVFRTGEGLGNALQTIKELQKRYENISIADKGATYNTNLIHAIEVGNLLDLAEVTVAGAVRRTESRGAHARRDFPTRDDDNWLKHTLAFYTNEGPKLDCKPVAITTWKPVERKY